MDDCVFCRIINKELPSTVAYEDESVLAIVPLHQAAKGHTLVIPKKHSVNVLDIENESLQEVMRVAHFLSPQIMEQNQATGINLLHAAGADAQQSVFHFHLHIVPRYPNDGIDLWFKNKL